MNPQIFLKLFLVAALCISQLAAQAHLVSHFQLDIHAEHHCDENSAKADCVFAELAHHNEHHSDEHAESQAIHKDCAIYHSYLSLSSCLATTVLIELPAVHEVIAASSNWLIVRQLATRNYAIRAPPLTA
ncbi:MAG: hypothetical protein AB8B84_03565 [Granulosicoccus sp.]